MPTTTVNGSSVTFSNSAAAANLVQTITEGNAGDSYLLSFDPLAASGGGAKAKLWSVDDGVKGDDNPAVPISNPAFSGYNTDLLYQDQAGVRETSAMGAKFWIDSTGHVQYDASGIGAQLDKLAAGDVFTDTIQYTIRLANGTLSVGTLAINIVGTDDLAVIQSGGDTGAVTEDSALLGTVSGNLQSTDVDGPGDQWTATNVSGGQHYGTFVMNAAGEWTYQLDNANAAVNALNTGQSQTDTFMVTTADGQSKDVVIMINGHTDLVPDPNDFDDLGRPTNDRIVDHGASSTLYGGAGNDEIFGNDGQDVIYGGSGNDTLHGQAGYDTVYGGSGDDVLFGNAMGDTLVGGLGADTISTGTGADAVVYQAVNEGGDTITDFARGLDHIDLSAIDATGGTSGDHAFVWGGTSATTNGVWYQYDAGALNPDGSHGATTVFADVNGDLTADFQIELVGNLALSASDFVL